MQQQNGFIHSRKELAGCSKGVHGDYLLSDEVEVHWEMDWVDVLEINSCIKSRHDNLEDLFDDLNAILHIHGR